MTHGSQALFTQVGFSEPSQDDPSQSHFGMSSQLQTQVFTLSLVPSDKILMSASLQCCCKHPTVSFPSLHPFIGITSTHILPKFLLLIYGLSLVISLGELLIGK